MGLFDRQKTWSTGGMNKLMPGGGSSSAGGYDPNQRANLMAMLDQQPKYKFAYSSPEFTQLREQISSGGPLAQYEQARKLLQLQAAQNLDRQTSDLAGQQATAYSQLAMGGGLSSGARERVALGGVQGNLMNRQKLRGETQTQYADIGAREAADKLEAQKKIAEVMASEQQRKQQMQMDAWKQRTETMASLDKADAQRRAASSNSCFFRGTIIDMADGSQKIIADIKVGDVVKDGGEVYCTQEATYGKSCYLYNGVYVTGSHAVYEDGVWLRVRDAKQAEECSHTLPKVYNIGTTNHVLWSNGVLFSDLHETDAYEVISDEDSLIRLNMVGVPGQDGFRAEV